MTRGKSDPVKLGRPTTIKFKKILGMPIFFYNPHGRGVCHKEL